MVTADVLHIVRNHASYLSDRDVDYVFSVKENQHRLSALLGSLDWRRTFTRIAPGCTTNQDTSVLP